MPCGLHRADQHCELGSGPTWELGRSRADQLAQIKAARSSGGRYVECPPDTVAEPEQRIPEREFNATPISTCAGASTGSSPITVEARQQSIGREGLSQAGSVGLRGLRPPQRTRQRRLSDAGLIHREDRFDDIGVRGEGGY